MKEINLLLIGDRDDAVTAHRAIPLAVAASAERAGCAVALAWPGTAALASDPGLVRDFDAFWCVPASPYANTTGAIGAIRHAREQRRPFLGTCGGFQHALLEYAHSVLGLDAAHAEESPDATDPLIQRMACSLVEVAGEIRVQPGSRVGRLVPSLRLTEEYHCSFGINPAWRTRLDDGVLHVTGTDPGGDPRIIELDDHPFYVATLFQPERAGLRGEAHPIITGFLAAAVDAADPRVASSPDRAGNPGAAP